MSDPFGIDVDPAFNGLRSSNYQYPDFDQSSPYAISKPGDPFQRVEPEAQSPAKLRENLDQSLSPSLARGVSAMDAVRRKPHPAAQRPWTTTMIPLILPCRMRYQIPHRTDRRSQANGIVRATTAISDSLQSRHVRDPSCAFGWPNVFGSGFGTSPIAKDKLCWFHCFFFADVWYADNDMTGRRRSVYFVCCQWRIGWDKGRIWIRDTLIVTARA